ncbi:MAG TPA: histidinol-phosphatase [Verrucomicrobiae bacterium]
MTRLGITLLLLICAVQLNAADKWWKGNLHTHTFWSDGDDFPEMATKWYKETGYHFLAISDHNILLEGDKWISIGTNATRKLALEKYRATYPQDVLVRTNGTNIQVRLATLTELKKRFEARNRFLLIPSEEISAEADKKPIHINATNLRDHIKPRHGTNVLDVMQMNIDAVLAQRQRTGQPMFPHLNHPNFHFAVSAEDLMRVEGEKFFEVYNGHPAVFNEGDEKHPSTERMWDMVLAWRLGVLNLEVMYGVAVDDTHNYHHAGFKNANPGRGWVMVRAKRLTPEHIVHAMEAGDFYASTGVRLKKMKRSANTVSLEIDPEPGVSYTISFIGTKRDFVKTVNGKAEADGSRIGELLAPEIKGTKAKYRLGKDDLYARAVVVSSKVKTNGQPEEVEKAWVQPIFSK